MFRRSGCGLVLLVCALCGCETEGPFGGGDAGDGAADATLVDLAASDLAIAIDAATPHDAAMDPDLATPPDLTPVDLTPPPFAIAPSTFVVPVGHSQIFVAHGATGWEITEPGGGAVVGQGDQGTYTAPTLAGTYHLTATNGTDTVGATITVVDFALEVAAGQPGGPGHLDEIGTVARLHAPWAVASDGVSVYASDTVSNVLRKIDLATGAVSTIAGTPYAHGSSDGVGGAALFERPWGVALDGTGGLYVADSNNQLLRRVELSTGEVTTVAGTKGLVGPVDGIGTSARFAPGGPDLLAYDGAGILYISDGGQLRSYDVATGAVTTLLPSIGANALAYDAGGVFFVPSYTKIRRYDVATTAVTDVLAAGPPGSMFFEGLVPDGTGSLYAADRTGGHIYSVKIADGTTTMVLDCSTELPYACRPRGMVSLGGDLVVTDSSSIRRVDVAAGTSTFLAGSRLQLGADDGPALTSRFSYPTGLVVDAAGRVYIGDDLSLRLLDPGAGTVSTVAGSYTSAVPADGVGTGAGFQDILAVALDGAGGLLLGDVRAIRQVALPSGSVTSPYGDYFMGGHVDASGKSARFAVTSGIVATGGRYYVADGHTVREIDPQTAAVGTLAGALVDGHLDGVGAAASFRLLQGITTDGAGRLFVSERGNTIRMIDIASRKVTTLAGVDGLAGGSDGVGSAAHFGAPAGLVWAGNETLIVADSGGATLRRVYVPTGAVSTLAGQVRVQAVRTGPLAQALFNHPTSLALDATGGLYVSSPLEPVILRLGQQ